MNSREKLGKESYPRLYSQSCEKRKIFPQVLLSPSDCIDTCLNTETL
jgi:hypothetical protein